MVFEPRLLIEQRTSWQRPVLGFINSEPVVYEKADRYIIVDCTDPDDVFYGHDNSIAVFDGNHWLFDTPTEGWEVYNKTDKYFYFFNSEEWEKERHSSIPTVPVESGLINLTISTPEDTWEGTETNDKITSASIINLQPLVNSVETRLAGRTTAFMASVIAVRDGEFDWRLESFAKVLSGDVDIMYLCGV